MIDYIIIAIIVIGIIVVCIHQKEKKKKGICDGGCSGCPFAGQCQDTDKKEKNNS